MLLRGVLFIVYFPLAFDRPKCNTLAQIILHLPFMSPYQNYRITGTQSRLWERPECQSPGCQWRFYTLISLVSWVRKLVSRAGVPESHPQVANSTHRQVMQVSMRS